MSAPLTFRQAAAKLGMGDTRAAGLRLKRLVLAREQQTGKRIATRGSGRKKSVRGVSISAIRRHLPEFREHRLDELATKFREHMQGIDDLTRRIAREEADQAITDRCEPQFAELRANDAEIQGRMNELASAVLGIHRTGRSRAG